MIISLRTFVNTTLLWIVIVFLFWGYTRFVDATPAKQFIHFLGWDQLANLTVTVKDEPLSNEMIVDKLASIEQICSRSVRLYMFDQLAPNQLPTPATPVSSTTVTQSSVASPLPGSQTIIPNFALTGLSQTGN